MYRKSYNDILLAIPAEVFSSSKETPSPNVAQQQAQQRKRQLLAPEAVRGWWMLVGEII